MADEPPPSARPSQSSGVLLLVTVITMLGMAVGVFVFQNWGRDEVKVAGFDVDRVDASPPPAVPAASPFPPAAPAPAPSPFPASGQSSAPGMTGPSGLTMITGGSPEMFAGSKAAAPAGPAPATGLTGAVRKNEGAFRALYKRYVDKYPLFGAYKREWASHPELAAAKAQWFRDKDPIAFMKAVAASPNAMPLVKKYATQPEMQKFIKEAATSAPSDVVEAVSAYLNSDGNAMALVKKFAGAAGIPPSLLAGFTGEKVDPNKAVSEMLSNPGAAGMLNPNAAPPRR